MILEEFLSCEHSFHQNEGAQRKSVDVVGLLLLSLPGQRSGPGPGEHPTGPSGAASCGDVAGCRGCTVRQSVSKSGWSSALDRSYEKEKTDTDGKESCSLEYLAGMASCPKVQCNSIHKYLSSNNYGFKRVNKRVSFPILITPGRCFRKKKNVARGRFDFSPDILTSENPTSYYTSLYLLCILSELVAITKQTQVYLVQIGKCF